MIDACEQNWINFFDNFEFQVGLSDLKKYEEDLRIRLGRLFKDNNILPILADYVKKKAMSDSDKQINVLEIKDFAVSHFKPLNQCFPIPPDYQIPDKNFYEAFIKRINNKEHYLFLIGEPGIGKSSFISKIISDLYNDSNKIIVRHHYFISKTDDDYSTRFWSQRVFSDLARQLNIEDKRMEKIPATLANIINNNKHPIIIIDGLDHLLRENKEYKDQLNELIRILKTYPNGITIIFASQPTDKDILDAFSKREKISFPLMDKNAIEAFLLLQNIEINKQDILNLVDTLKNKTQGNPTILRLFIESIRNIMYKKPVNHYVIEDIPAYNGKINDFYFDFYNKLSLATQTALQIVGSFDFYIWNHDCLDFCLTKLNFSKTEIIKSLNDINLFFETTDNILSVRHESFILFLKHISQTITDKYDTLVLGWLEQLHPDAYWRLCYLPILKIKNHSFDFVSITRDWVANMMIYGYGTLPIIRILYAAEKALFEMGNYSELLRIKHINVRLQNNTYNIHDMQDLEFLSFSLIPNKDFHYALIRNKIDIGYSSLTIIHSIQKDRQFDKIDIAESLWQSEKYEIVYKQKNEEVRVDIDIRNFLHMAILLDKPRVARNAILNNLVDFVSELAYKYKKVKLIKELWTEIKKEQNYMNLFSIRENTIYLFKYEKLKYPYNCIDIDYIIGNSPMMKYWQYRETTLIPEIDKDRFVATLLENWKRLYSNDRLIDINIDKKWINQSFVEYFFYFVLYKKDIVISKFHKNFLVLNAFLVNLHQFACNTKYVKTSQEFIDIFNNWLVANHSMYNNNSEILYSIIHPVARMIFTNYTIITYGNFESISKETVLQWVQLLNIEDFFINKNHNNCLSIPDETINDYKKIFYKKELETKIEEIIAYYQKLAKLEINTTDFEQARIALKNVYLNALGYCSHKDLFVFEVIDSIKYCYNTSIGLDKNWDIRISKIVHNIENFTDGDETHHAKSEIIELLYHISIDKAISYYNHVFFDRWLSLNIYSELADLAKQAGFEKYFTGTVNEENQKSESERDYNKIKEKEFSFLSATPPKKFNKLVKYFDTKKSSWDYDKLFSKWITIWENTPKANDLLEIIEANISIIEQWGISDSFNKLASLFLQKEGKTKAYKYFVLAHKHNYGWDKYYSHSSKERLKEIADIYSTDWQRFIKDSNQSKWRNEQNHIYLGQSLLVYYLCNVEQYEIAERITEILLSSLEEDTAFFYMEDPSWMQQ